MKRKTQRSFCIASALNDIGDYMIRPFWPIFITSVLGIPTALLGVIEGIGDSVAQLVRFPAGYFSDRLRKRKVFIWFGYLLGGLSRVGYALSQFVSWIIPFKIMDRMGKIRDPPRDAMLSNITKKKKRGKEFGILRSADHFGTFLGPIIAFFLVMYIGYRELFFLAAIPSIIGALIIYKFVKEEKIVSRIKYHFDFRRLSRNYKMLLLSSIVFSLSWFSLSFMILFVSKFVDIILLPFLYVVMGLAAAIISMPAGWISDRIGRKPLLLIGYVLFSLVCLGFVLFDNSLALVMSFGLFALYGVHYGIITTLQSPFVSDLVPKNKRASAIGLYQTATGLALLPASIIAGLLWDIFSPPTTFIFGVAVSAVGIAMLFVLVKEN